MTKPFELRELEARFQALIRSCYGGFNSYILVGRLALDTQQQTILADGQAIILSASEYGVLEVFLMQAGKVVGKDCIAQPLSYEAYGLSDNTIEINIHRLRKDIEPYDGAINTVRGLPIYWKRQMTNQTVKNKSLKAEILEIAEFHNAIFKLAGVGVLPLS